jgi:hypothetical protein
MEINKLTNHIQGQVNGANNGTDGVQQTSRVNSTDKSTNSQDQVSINSFGAKKNDELFAKIELEKLNQTSFGKLKDMKAKIQAFEAAKNESPEAAAQTEIGKMLNDPGVWDKIAQNIVDK